MVLQSDELRRLINGAVRVEKESDQLVLWRFSRTHFTRMADNDHYSFRAKAASGMTIDFETNSQTLSLSLAIEPASGVPLYGMDVMVNDQLFHHEENQNGCLTTTTHVMLPDGQKRITIYLPNLCRVSIINFELDDGASWVPVPHKCKVLYLGDSITQGYVTEYPSRTYVHLLNRVMDAECLNQAIGGAVYDAEQLDDESGYHPEIFFAAYGTNDWALKQDLTKNAEQWYEKLHQLYGSTTVYTLLPIWRIDCKKGEAEGYEDFLHARNRIKEVCDRYPNCYVLDTIDYLPHDKSFFCDGLHPNESGFACYAEAILNAIKDIHN